MAFQLSPGVNVSEIDLTTVVPAVATSTGAIAGNFAWGPVNEIVTISDEVRLADTFGKPNEDNYEHWFSASNFLSYSNNLKVVRAAGSGALNAGSNSTGVLVGNDDEYSSATLTLVTHGEWIARFPGELGNSLSVEMVDSNTITTLANSGLDKFVPSAAPGTSTWVNAQGGSDDELHVIVIDAQGKFTGVAGQVLETFLYVSKASDAKDDYGNTNYYAQVINNRSKYIRWAAHTDLTTAAESWGNTAANVTFANLTSNVTSILNGGADGTYSSGNTVTGLGLFASAEAVDVSLLIGGPADSTVVSELHDIVESRKDCLAFISPEKADVVNNAGSEATDAIAYRDGLTSSSFLVMDSNWKYQYDKYNDKYRWIPCNADVAGACARTDQQRDPWYSPGGLNRGILKNVIKLAWNPNQADRDNLYQKGINPIVSFAGEGTVLFGDKTMLSKPSAFDRINVRRLFIVLEKAISRAARYSMFEFNDQFTRAQFVNLVEPFLRDVQGRRGITDFRVVCDESNNTGQVIDRNEFVGDIYIKPARSINFIQLNFVAVRTGVSFNEVVGQF